MIREEPLKAAKAELIAAEKALAAMEAAKDFSSFEEEWRSLLNNLEKVWIKTERACHHIQNKFQPWQGKYSQLRRKDMLLRYLKQARDADNHSVQEVMEKKPGHYSFTVPGGPGVVHIESLRVEGGRVVEYKGSHPATETIVPPRLACVPVKNSGAWYNPPPSHLGQHVVTDHPVIIGRLGLAFYKDFVAQVEQTFFNANPP